MIFLNSTILIVTLKVNILDIPIKKQTSIRMGKKGIQEIPQE